MRLYEENTHNGYGNLIRADAYWRWLVSRGGNQRIYVAINGPDKFQLDESLTPIVGYAATREGRIVEIMSTGDHHEASVQLLRAPAAMPSKKTFSACDSTHRRSIRCINWCCELGESSATMRLIKAWCSW